MTLWNYRIVNQTLHCNIQQPTYYLNLTIFNQRFCDFFWFSFLNTLDLNIAHTQKKPIQSRKSPPKMRFWCMFFLFLFLFLFCLFVFLSFLDIFDLWIQIRMMQVRTCWAFWDLGEKSHFWCKNMFLACFEAFVHFLFGFVLIITFWLKFMVIQLHTYCCLCILSQKCEFSVFLVKVPIFHTLLKVCEIIYFSFWLLLNLSLRYFLMHTCWEFCILGQKAVFFFFFFFFDKNIISGCIGYAKFFFSFVMVESKLLMLILDNPNV